MSDLSYHAGMSYRKAEWVPEAEVMEAKPQLLRNFMQRRYAGRCLPGHAAALSHAQNHTSNLLSTSQHQDDLSAPTTRILNLTCPT